MSRTKKTSTAEVVVRCKYVKPNRTQRSNLGSTPGKHRPKRETARAETNLREDGEYSAWIWKRMIVIFMWNTMINEKGVS